MPQIWIDNIGDGFSLKKCWVSGNLENMSDLVEIRIKTCPLVSLIPVRPQLLLWAPVHEAFPWQLPNNWTSSSAAWRTQLPSITSLRSQIYSIFSLLLRVTHPPRLRGRGTDSVIHFSVGDRQSLTKKSMGAGEEISRYSWNHLWKILSASTNRMSETFSHCVQIKIGTIKNRCC